MKKITLTYTVLTPVVLLIYLFCVTEAWWPDSLVQSLSAGNAESYASSGLLLMFSGLVLLVATQLVFLIIFSVQKQWLWCGVVGLVLLFPYLHYNYLSSAYIEETYEYSPETNFSVEVREDIVQP